jgi:hypothetical protein
MRARSTCTSRRVRGAAMVEAIVALPVLVIVLIAVPYVHQLFVAHQSAMSSARHDAWSSALGKCPVGKDGPAVDVFDTLDALQNLPVVGPVFEGLVPQSMHMSSNRKLQRPKLLANKPDDVQAAMHLTCNEDWPSFKDAILDKLAGYLP